MPLTLEQIEGRLTALERRQAAPTRRPGLDARIPLLATSFDLESAIFSPAVRVHGSGNQTITTGSTTGLTFNTERFDTDGMHSTVSNTSRLTAKTAGIYLITGNVRWANNTTGRRILLMRINGGDTIAQVEIHGPPVSGHVLVMNVTTIYELLATDYVELSVFQDSGGDLDIVATGNYTPEFAMAWVAPSP